MLRNLLVAGVLTLGIAGLANASPSVCSTQATIVVEPSGISMQGGGQVYSAHGALGSADFPLSTASTLHVTAYKLPSGDSYHLEVAGSANGATFDCSAEIPTTNGCPHSGVDATVSVITTTTPPLPPLGHTNPGAACQIGVE